MPRACVSPKQAKTLDVDGDQILLGAADECLRHTYGCRAVLRARQKLIDRSIRDAWCKPLVDQLLQLAHLCHALLVLPDEIAAIIAYSRLRAGMVDWSKEMTGIEPIE